jgi:hypothetical protein
METKPKYSQIKNAEPGVKVLSEDELPETRQMVRIEKMDMPLTTVEEAKAMWQQYQDLISALIKENDVVVINGKKRVMKSGVNKIARFFGYSVEIIKTKKEEIIGPQGGHQFVWYAWVKAVAPNGRFRVEGAACSSVERRFAHVHHDVLAQAITRANSRAIQELAGMGELEFDEEVGTDESETKKKSKAKPKPKRDEATERQMEYIATACEKAGLDPLEAQFTQPGGIKKIEDLTSAEAEAVIAEIGKGKEAFLMIIVQPETPAQE